MTAPTHRPGRDILPPLPPPLEAKAAALVRILGGFPSALVACSGGVDSTLLALLTRRVLGPDRMLAVIADTPTLPRRDLAAALAAAGEYDIPCRTVTTRELEDPVFARNEARRCYFCKQGLFAAFREAFGDRFTTILCGTNTDDAADWRPGLQAEEEAGVRRPLLEAGFTKEDIRELSRRLGLATWNRPAGACLASRIPYGEEITREKLARVERAEEVLHGAGFRLFRVRHLGPTARIEVAGEELRRLEDPELRAKIVRGVREAGFAGVEVDPEPYRSGRLNENLPAPDPPTDGPADRPESRPADRSRTPT